MLPRLIVVSEMAPIDHAEIHEDKVFLRGKFLIRFLQGKEAFIPGDVLIMTRAEYILFTKDELTGDQKERIMNYSKLMMEKAKEYGENTSKSSI